MKEKIQLINAGCASKNGFIRIDPDIFNTISTINEVSNGQEIPLVTIDEIIKKYHVLDNSILKVDCEGCEYDIIRNLSKNSFQKFSDIFIEYHNGYEELKKILEKEEFSVKITKPVATNVINSIFSFINNHTTKNEIGYVGFIHATKNFHENNSES
ncbi:FkbM family methyltransferase [Marine Group I thaumarchaeote]|uniref:FkbM family methyltransferase n=1 Tax=Marine Group I thaumarchaeote TaxID=2511932 RepID=A0A7K4MMP8_9ARCH|nr:FkbM family methyltransferase [Marine Group I thaumarchaeote]